MAEKNRRIKLVIVDRDFQYEVSDEMEPYYRRVAKELTEQVLQVRKEKNPQQSNGQLAESLAIQMLSEVKKEFEDYKKNTKDILERIYRKFDEIE